MATKKSPSPFDIAVFQFLAELALHNERPWFAKNKSRYESAVREPALAFIRAAAPGMARISKQLVVSDAKVGGSLMRLHRDTRFSKDKSPYKTNVGIHFRHAAGKDVHAPGVYLHISPEACFIGAGMWHPEPSALSAVRKAIVDNPKAWVKIRDDAAFVGRWERRGASLSRAPKGFPPDHPMIDDLKRKDHIAVLDLKPGDVTRPGFVEHVLDAVAVAKPYLRWQAKALGLAQYP